MKPLIQLRNNTRVGGEYQFVIIDPMTRRTKRETPWMPNLITDIGMDRIANMAGGRLGDFLSIGTGTTTPTFADTQLVNRHATTSTIVAGLASNAGSPTYVSTQSITFEFPLGAVIGNMTEVGIGWSNTAKFSRALIVDGGGTPTAVSVLSSEILQVNYRLHFYPQLTDSVGTFTIAGSGDHDYVARHLMAGTTLGNSIFTANPTASGLDCQTFDGSIVAVSGSSPTGVAGAISSVAGSYTPGTFYRDFTLTALIGQSNFGTGIKSMTLKYKNLTGGGGDVSYFRTQCQFTPPIMKTGAQVLTLLFRQSWARH